MPGSFWRALPCRWHYRFMNRINFAALLAVAFMGLAVKPLHAVQLKVSRAALQRTLEGQLFTGPGGHYYLKGSPAVPCSVYADNPKLSFAGNRILVEVRTHARIGTAVRGVCIGITLSPTSAVSVAPSGEGETIGFQDARVERVSGQKELNFLLMPFLSHQIPGSMTVNSADLLRKALADSTATSGYKVSLDCLKIRSVQIQGDNVLVDLDCDLSVQ